MPTAKINDKGQVVDAETGKVIGKLQNGKVVVTNPQPRTEVQNEKSTSNTNVQQNVPKQSNVPNKESSKPLSSYKDLTKYQVTKDSTFTIKFGLLQQDGRFIPIKEQAILNYKNAELVWVKFRMWTFQQQIDWKNKCQDFNMAMKCQVLNTNKLNEMKIKRLILDWSFGENYDRLKLLHTDGILSDESYNMFKGLYPAIANTIIEFMNNVLENNL